MIKFDKEKVLLLYQILSQEISEAVGETDLELLDSILENTYAESEGEELYKTKEEKAAALGLLLITNRTFACVNTRMGLYVMLTSLEVGGIRMTFSNDDVVKLGRSVEIGKMQYDDILKWIKRFEME